MPRAKMENSSGRRRAPARGADAREAQLITLATNLAEKQLREGTASSQVIAHYLRLGTSRERLEQERLRHENELAQAKTESIRASQKNDALYEEALNAFRSYSPRVDSDYDDY